MKPPFVYRARVVVPAVLIVLAVPNPIKAQGGSCSYDPNSHTVTIQTEPPEFEFRLRNDLRVLDSQIMYQRSPCSGATVTNTDTINLLGVPDGEFFNIHGPFAPGFSPEADGLPEIEIMISLAGEDYVTLYGTNQADAIVVGTEGYNLNRDDDMDVFAHAASVETLELDVIAGGGADFISSRGGRGTGGPFVSKHILQLRMYGEEGPDRVLDGRYKALLSGGPSRDRLDGGAGNDMLDGFGAEGKDRLVGGLGRDTCYATPAKDRTKSCERILEPTS
jgi:hypothetical protein